ncbi:MAG: hypothetical protein AAGD13_15215 [Pseudomonadota bacterium]
MSRLILRNAYRAREAYAPDFLLRELPKAIEAMTDDEFTRFQCRAMRGFHDDFCADSLSVLITLYEKGGKLERPIYTGRYKVDPNARRLYMQVADLDAMDPLNRELPGTAVLNSDFMDLGRWRKTEFFERFKAHTGTHHALILSYPYPFKTGLGVRFTFQTDFPREFGQNLTKDVAEYLNLPFYLAWLHRLNVIDLETLTRWLELMAGLTPQQVALLRLLSNLSPARRPNLAEDLGLPQSIVDQELRTISQVASNALPDVDGSQADDLSTADLASIYSHLRFCGRFVDQQHVQRRAAELLPTIGGGVYAQMVADDSRAQATARN